MALTQLTKVDGGGISTTSDYRVGVITASKFVGPFDGTGGNFSGVVTATNGVFSGNISAVDGTFSGNVTIGGTLTYEDVTNIDSVGLVTARDGIDCNGDLDVDGHTNLDNVSIAGVTTFSNTVHVGTGVTIETNGQGTFSGIVTSRGFNVPQTSDNGATNSFIAGRIKIFDPGSQCQIQFGDHPSYAPHQKYASAMTYRTSSFTLQNTGSTRTALSWVNSDGAVNLWYTGGYSPDYGVKLNTHSGGILVSGVTTTRDLAVTGVSTFTGNLDANGDLDVDGHTNLDNVSVAGVTTFASNIYLGDNDRIYLGADNDMILWNDGNNGLLYNNTGHFYIRGQNNTTIQSDVLYIKNDANNEDLAKFTANGAVELYNNNEKKLQTHYEGIQVYDTSSNQSMIRMNTSGGFSGAIYAVGNSVISLLRSNLQWGVKVNNGSSTELYHTGNAKKLETTSTGISITQDLDVDGHTNLDNVSISGIATALRLDTKNGSQESHFAVNQLQFNPTGDSYIDNKTNNKDIYFRLSRSSAMDTTMMQLDSDGEIIKFHKQISVGLQGGSDTAVLGGGSGIGAQLTLKYSDGNINSRLLGNGNSYLNVNHGNLGVGIAVASKKLHVYKSNQHPVMLERGDSNNTIIELKTDGATRGFWGCSTTANFMVYDNDTSDINFTVNQDGNVDIAGEVSTAQDYPNIRPTLDLNFAATKKLDSRIKYTRTGLASFINEHGLVEIVNSNVPRFDHDPVTRECKGLLIEESRTNLLTYSNIAGMSSPNLGGNPQVNDTVEDITLPTGEKGTVRRYLANAPGGGGRWGDYSGTNNQSYTGSVWVRTVSGTGSAFIDVNDGGGKSINLTTEWQRVTTTHSSNNTYRFFDIYFSNPVTVYFWGVQFEEGAFMTSYIPTFTTTGTRGSDLILMDGEEFSKFYNPIESTILVDYTHDFVTSSQLGTVQRVYRFRAVGGSDTRIDYVSNSGYNPYIAKDGATVASISHGQPTVFGGGANRTAVRVKENLFASSFNGSTVVEDTSGGWNPTNTITEVSLGSNNGGNALNGHIQRFTYYPVGVSNNQLRNLTS